MIDEQDLRRALHAQVAEAAPRPDLADVRARAGARRRHRTAARAVGIALLLVLVAVVAGRAADRSVRPAASPAEVPGVALVLDGAPTRERRTLERVNRAAATGPWSVVARRTGESITQGAAVVTYPVPSMVTGRTVEVRGAAGQASSGVITWPLGGGVARVRGDLSDDELLAVARATTLDADGRPEVGRVPGLGLVTWRAPYASPLTREARYGAAELGEDDVLGAGLVFAGIDTGVELLERTLLSSSGDRYPGLAIAGRPARFTTTLGNGVLVAELSPGVVAFVGWSGASAGPDQIAAIGRVAQRLRLLDEAGWQATEPQPIDDTRVP